MVPGVVGHPDLDIRSHHLDGAPAVPADQMMMGGATAATEEFSAILPDDCVEVAGLDELTQPAQQRRQVPRLAIARKECVKLTSASEPIQVRREVRCGNCRTGPAGAAA